MPRKTSWLLNLFTVLLDALLIGAAFIVAYLLRRATEYPLPLNPVPFARYQGMLIIQVLSMVVTFAFYRLYEVKPGLSRIDKTYSIIGAVSLGTITSVACTAFVYKNSLDYPRAMVIYAWTLTIPFVIVGRLLTDALQVSYRRANATRVAIVGGDDLGLMVLQKINQSPKLGYQPVGFIDDAPGRTSVAGLPVLGNTCQIGCLIREQNIQEVIIALPNASHEEVLDLISQCEREHAVVRIFPDVFQIIASELSIDDLNGLPLLTVRDVALRGWRKAVKRGMDVAVSTIGLIVLSPLMLLVALAIKLESPGPVFFLQERMGLDARPFQMLKFRSMRTDAEKETGPVWTVENDPRRTYLGAFIRKYSIDELPQFINVLVGDMSLVGPRPERPVFVEQFRQIVPRYMDRHKEKAGITGWAQVNGLRGDTSIVERTKYDLWYIENWSLLLDIKILIRTIFGGFRGRNAY